MVMEPTFEAWLADPKRIDAWVTGAQVGEALTYARMPELPARSSSGEAARRHHAAGTVELRRKRVAPGLFDFIMVRQAPRIGARKTLTRPVLDSDCVQVKSLLRRYAREGRACPTNAKIAHLTGLKKAEKARYAIRKLANAGVLRTEIIDPVRGDRIVIFSDGAQTPMPKESR